MNRIHSSASLLAALGVIGASGVLVAPASAQVDTTKWTCSKCPYPKGLAGSIDAGLGAVSDDSLAFADWRGLERKGAHLVLGGELQYRGGNGYHAELAADELGLDTRGLKAQAGREGLYSLNLGYTSIPRHFADGARTPFLGSGSGTLTLPAGYPAAGSGAMPLSSTLRDADLGFDWRRLDFGGSWLGLSNWTFRVNLRRDVRDGTRPFSASFFSTASQLPAPVDQVTDQLEVSAAYADARMQGQLAYVISQFRNDTPALRWTNPFLPVTAGATTGQVALAPDNQQHQLVGSGSIAVMPWLRASGDFAVGQMKQNEAYLPSTITPGLDARPLPAASLDGQVNTFNGSVRVVATPIDPLRLTAVYVRNVRQSDTRVRSYPQVSADVFATQSRENMPSDLWQDRVKLSADWRGPATLRVSGGADWDRRERSYAEAVETRETTVWLRGSFQPIETLTLSLKASGSDRNHSEYGVATWLTSPENPLMRKYNLADRQRQAASVRADLAISESLSIGFSADVANDDYDGSLIGLTQARQAGAAVDVAWSLGERTKVYAYLQGERIRSTLAGSESFRGPDWSARSRDRFEIVGLGVQHAAIPDKLDIGADLTVSRSRSQTAVETVLAEPPLPGDRTARDSLKLHATYKLSEQLSLLGSFWYEKFDARDWHLDGVLPATVPTLLLFGNPPPNYKVNVVRLALRYRF